LDQTIDNILGYYFEDEIIPKSLFWKPLIVKYLIKKCKNPSYFIYREGNPSFIRLVSKIQ
jgi:hypothetical protein